MKKFFLIIAVISFLLYALVDFLKNVFEVYFRVLLMNDIGNFTNNDYTIDATTCQSVLLAVGVICIVGSVIPFFLKNKR